MDQELAATPRGDLIANIASAIYAQPDRWETLLDPRSWRVPDLTPAQIVHVQKASLLTVMTTKALAQLSELPVVGPKGPVLEPDAPTSSLRFCPGLKATTVGPTADSKVAFTQLGILGAFVVEGFAGHPFGTAGLNGSATPAHAGRGSHSNTQGFQGGGGPGLGGMSIGGGGK